MKKNIVAILALILTLTFNAFAQDKTDDKKNMSKTDKVYKANPSDVESIDAIIKAVYDVISGEANQKRDWDRFQSLFHKDARLIPTQTNPKTRQQERLLLRQRNILNAPNHL